MTDACGGGPSGTLPGTNAVITLTAVPVELLAAEAGAPPPVAAAIGAIVAGAADIATANFCATDPPADPGLQPSDMQAILDPGNFAAFSAASSRVINWFLHQYWFKVCGCTGAAAPTPPALTLPTSPGGNTNLPTGAANPPCWTAQTATTITYAGTGANSWKDVTAQLIPATTGVPVHQDPAAGSSSTAQTLPNGVSTIQLYGQSSYANLAAEPIWLHLVCYDSSGNPIGAAPAPITTLSERVNNHPTFSLLGSVAVPTNAVSAQAFVANYTSVTDQDVQVGINFLCGTGQTIVQPCCPPDPTIQQYLNMILQLVQNLQNAPAASTSWTPGTAHTGISGTGSFNIAKGVTGVRADFTTIPSDIQQTPGTPTFYWSLGFVTPLAMTYPLRSLRTVFAQQDMPLPIQTDGLAYTLAPGAVATLTELLPA